LALIPRHVSESGKMSSMPPEIKYFLNEFQEIVGDYLPLGLLPLRSISN
jgi:hypothetical protein